MRILLTGVTSFLGNALADELILRGHEVYGVLRPDSPNRADAEKISGLHLVEADMKEFGMLSRRGLPAMDICLHFAWAGVGRTGRQDPVIQGENEDATIRLCEAAAELGCKCFIFAGSQAEYGVTAERVSEGMYSGEPVKEDTVCRPLSEYGKAKLRMLTACGSLARSLGMKYLHLRIFSVYGEGDHPCTLVNLCCRAFAAGEHLKLSACAQNWNMLYVGDCARAIADLTEAGTEKGPAEKAGDRGTEECETGCVVNIGSEDTRPLKEFVEEIRSVCGKGSYELKGSNLSQEGTPWLSPDITRLKRLTGFRPAVSFREGVDRIIRHSYPE